MRIQWCLWLPCIGLLGFGCGGSDSGGGGGSGASDAGVTGGSGGSVGGSGGSTGGSGGSVGGASGSGGAGGSCADECASSSCDGTTYKQCGELDDDTCLDAYPDQACDTGNACLVPSCDGATGCTSTPVVCNSPPANTCLDPNTLQTYDVTGACNASGDCEYTSNQIACPNCPACDACANVTCNNPPSPCHVAVGSCSNGSCTYAYDNGKSCDDGDSCTDNDQCGTGVCAGSAKACNTPPSSCYVAVGTCNAGTCNYVPDDGKNCSDLNACTTGDTCSAGTCTGQAVTCNNPPAPTCVNAKTLRTYSLPGTCTSPAGCGYTQSDSTCAFACQSGTCVACTDEIVVADATTQGSSPSIEVDSFGGVHITYRSTVTGDLRYATRAFGGTFSASSADAVATVSHTSLGLDSTNGNHVAYDDGAPGYALLYGYRSATGGSWSKTTVDSANHVLQSGGIFVDSKNALHIAYQASPGANAQLRYAFRAATGGAWTNSGVDLLATGGGASLVADGNGVVDIVYYGNPALNGGLRHASRSTTGGAWTLATIDAGAATSSSFRTSIARSATALHVAYYDSLNGDLEYAEKAFGGSWATSSVDANSAGSYLSLAVDSSGGVHIAYYDSANLDLKYAYRPSGGSFSTVTVDSAGSVGSEVGISVEPNGTAHIAYRDFTGGSLKYARRCP